MKRWRSDLKLIATVGLVVQMGLMGAIGLAQSTAWYGLSYGQSTQREAEGRSDGIYDRGSKALDERRWDAAVELFGEVARLRSSKADGALYWKAYAQTKQGQRAEALATLESLRKSYPGSRWLNEAGALQLEIKQASGQPVSPENTADDDLKLMALNGLLNSDPERAIPMLEKFLQGNQPPKLKDRALFVLAQSGSPRAQEILNNIARGNANPELQMKAINHLGLFGGKTSRQTLADIYSASTDIRVKRAILRGFMVGGERDRLLAAAKGEQILELRKEAIQQLGILGAQTELWDLYQAERTPEIREQILNALFIGGNTDRLLEVARTEKDPRIRKSAIRWLGVSGASKTGEALLAIYSSDKDPEIRKQIIEGLFIQVNAKALIDLARKESDPAMKREIVSKLSIMGSKEATDYLMEILNK
jgi:HEAT repeat protein